MFCLTIGSESIKSEESESLIISGIKSTEKAVESPIVNNSEKSPHNCLKLTIRVRRLHNLNPSHTTNSGLNESKNSFNQNNDNNNNISINANEDSLLNEHSSVLYEVLPSSSATTSSSASECSSTVTTGTYLSSDPTLIRYKYNRNKKKKKKKSKRKYRENSSNYRSVDTTSPVRVSPESVSSPLNGAKRLRLIVGKDTISIDIKKKLSHF